MLHPARLRKILLKFPLCRGANPALMIEDNGPRTRGPLVNRKYKVLHIGSANQTRKPERINGKRRTPSMSMIFLHRLAGVDEREKCACKVGKELGGGVKVGGEPLTKAELNENEETPGEHERKDARLTFGQS